MATSLPEFCFASYENTVVTGIKNAVISSEGKPCMLGGLCHSVLPPKKTLGKSRQDNMGQLILDFHLWQIYLSAL